MQDRLDNLYDRISGFENEIADVEEKIKAAYGRQISEKQLYQILQKFDILYAEMSDIEKKEFMQLFIDAIELYPEKMDDGRIIRQIDLAFPVYYEGFEGEAIRLLNENTVETVCLLSKLHEAKHHVNVKLDMDELDLTAAESKATYEEIKSYVAEHYDGMKVSNLYIAQVKAKYGIIERENYNKAKSDDARQPKCPKEKEEAIVEALRYFQMILSET